MVGGENAGLSVASKLLIKNKKLDIGILELSLQHYYQPIPGNLSKILKEVLLYLPTHQQQLNAGVHHIRLCGLPATIGANKVFSINAMCSLYRVDPYCLLFPNTV